MAIELGGIVQPISRFVSSNLIAVITIVVTILGIIGTPYYLRNRITSAEKERFNQAKNSLLDILENHVINDRDISRERVNNILAAIERERSVSITDRMSTIEILQNLQLRIEESKLDVDDKEEYSQKIEDKINNLKEERRVEDLPTEYQLAIEELELLDDISPEKIVGHFEEARMKRRRESYLNGIELIRYALTGQYLELPPEDRRRMAVQLLRIYAILLFMMGVVITVTRLL